MTHLAQLSPACDQQARPVNRRGCQQAFPFLEKARRIRSSAALVPSENAWAGFHFVPMAHRCREDPGAHSDGPPLDVSGASRGNGRVGRSEGGAQRSALGHTTRSEERGWIGMHEARNADGGPGFRSQANGLAGWRMGQARGGEGGSPNCRRSAEPYVRRVS